MKYFRSIFLFICINLLLGVSFVAKSQVVEEKFQDVFITAAYATGFGAALGTALLSFQDDPTAHLRYIFVGASLGFIGGTLLGTYIVFSPVIAEKLNDGSSDILLSSSNLPASSLAIIPTFNPKTNKISQVKGAWTFSRF